MTQLLRLGPRPTGRGLCCSRSISPITTVRLIPDAVPDAGSAVDGIMDGFEPETFLWITFHRPDGGLLDGAGVLGRDEERG